MQRGQREVPTSQGSESRGAGSGFRASGLRLFSWEGLGLQAFKAASRVMLVFILLALHFKPLHTTTPQAHHALWAVASMSASA